MYTPLTNRLSSLDNLRALAIILVILFHYQLLISHTNNFWIFSQIGWIGVDLFFVLSGYLISNQIFKSIINHQHFSLKQFYLKRMFKTLPSYYFVLLMYLYIPHFAETPITVPLWKYLLFVQNFYLPLANTGFIQSWSLCIEEQFYLIFPFIVILLHKCSTKTWLSIALSIILGGMLLRGVLWYHLYTTNNFANYETIIYFPTYGRLDGLICGIAVAYIQHYCPTIWQRLIQKSSLILYIGLVILCIFIPIIYDRKHLLATVIGFPGIAVAFSIIVLSALGHNSFLAKLKSVILHKIALWSYAIYLTQVPISIVLAKYFTFIGLNNNAYLTICANIMLQILFGAIFFYCIEKRFILFRDKILKR